MGYRGREGVLEKRVLLSLRYRILGYQERVLDIHAVGVVVVCKMSAEFRVSETERDVERRVLLMSLRYRNLGYQEGVLERRVCWLSFLDISRISGLRTRRGFCLFFVVCLLPSRCELFSNSFV